MDSRKSLFGLSISGGIRKKRGNIDNNNPNKLKILEFMLLLIKTMM